MWQEPEETPAEDDGAMLVEKQFYAEIIKSADAFQGLVTGVVLQPDVPDAQGDIYDALTIREAAHDFMSHYRSARFGTSMGEMHKTLSDDIEVVESWIQPNSVMMGNTLIKAESWMLTVKVKDQVAKEKVRSGEYRGFSIGGKAKAIPLT